MERSFQCACSSASCTSTLSMSTNDISPHLAIAAKQGAVEIEILLNKAQAAVLGRDITAWVNKESK
jgi:hypothetical protein